MNPYLVKDLCLARFGVGSRHNWVMSFLRRSRMVRYQKRICNRLKRIYGEIPISLPIQEG